MQVAEALLQCAHDFVRFFHRISGLHGKAERAVGGERQARHVGGASHQRGRSRGKVRKRADDFRVGMVPDQDNMAPVPVVPFDLAVHLRDQRAHCIISMEAPPPPL